MILKVSKSFAEELRHALKQSIERRMPDKHVIVQESFLLTGNQWALFDSFGTLIKCSGFTLPEVKP